MIPEFPNFTRITYEHRDELEKALRATSIGISEFSLGFLYGYAENFSMELTKIFGNICVFGMIHYSPSFMPPLGENNLTGTAEICLNYLKNKYGKGRINAVTRQLSEVFRNDKRFTVADDRDNYDYIYSVNSLSRLAGDKYQPKRNLIKQFEKRYKFEYCQLTESLLPQCVELQDRWCRTKDCRDNESMLYEDRFVRALLKDFVSMNFFGAAMLIEGTVQAFTIAESVKPDTALIHAEKADISYRGIYQKINNLFCKNGLKNFTFINREQDVGSPGLRRAKLSYYPDHFMDKYNIELA